MTMKPSIYKTLAITLMSCGLLVACSDNDDDGGVVAEEPDFAFSTADFSAYTRVDRMGMPAIATALISSKDSYNQADPDDDLDAANPFVGEILTSLESLHTALDDDLAGASLTPCTVVGDGTGTCAAFAVPLIIPDTIKLDTSAAAGFPNGRLLTDPVIDVTLAVALLELTGEPAPHTPTALVGVLNPSENDREFRNTFPFLATPNQ